MGETEKGFNPPNYTAVPNKFWDFLPFLREAELKIMLFAIRKTFGWHKDSDHISLSQFEAGTGLTRTNVTNGIDRAKTRGILVELPERGPRGIKLYQVVVNDTTSIATGLVTKTTSIAKGLVTSPATGLDDALTSPVAIPTKETKTKETKEKKIKDSPDSAKGATGVSATDQQPAIKKSLSKHEKRLETDKLYAAAAQVWKTSAPGWLNNVVAMLRGNSKTGEWAKNNFAEHMLPPSEDLIQWGLDCDQFLPQVASKIQKSYYDWLAEQIDKGRKHSKEKRDPQSYVTGKFGGFVNNTPDDEPLALPDGSEDPEAA